MLTETVEPQPENGPNSETDLGALAEHLSVIADALRKTTGNPHELDIIANLTSSSETESNGDRQLTAFAAGPALGGAPVFASDLKIQRRRYADLARDAYAVRRRRGVIFDNDELFGEPAWDILLDLYVAHAENKSVSVSSACIGSAAPPTTGLRWLGVLSEQALILREHDPDDQRRVLVCLTEKGLTAMDAYFASIGMPG